LKNPFLAHNALIIAVFGSGCVIGLLGFSRVLNFLLQRFHNLTIAFLTGLMTGSLLKIWPWKEVIETRMIRGKAHVIWGGNVLPESLGAEVVFAVVLAIIGFIAVMVIEGLSRKNA
jgi:putative membrane protein